MKPLPPPKRLLRWTDEMERALIETLLSAVRNGLRADSGYKGEAWKRALEAVQKVTEQDVNIKQIKSKHDNQKRDWRTWKDLLNQSGFGKDEDGCITADLEVLETYFKSHPDARRFGSTQLKFEELLAELFQDVLATGVHAYTPADLIEPVLLNEIQDSIEDSPRAESTTPRSSSVDSRSASRGRKRTVEETIEKRSSHKKVHEMIGESIAKMVDETEELRIQQQKALSKIDMWWSCFVLNSRS